MIAAYQASGLPTVASIVGLGGLIYALIHLIYADVQAGAEYRAYQESLRAVTPDPPVTFADWDAEGWA